LVAGLPLIGTKGGAPGYKSVGRSRIHDSIIIIINTINFYRHVHVLCLYNLTIETYESDSDDMKYLEAAISAAEAKKIVMFCSASDEGNGSIDRSYPGDWEKCIKIGAATATGEKFPWVHGQKVNFLLPGENIPFKSSDGTMRSFMSGSSVATAAASGLAGLLLHCNKLVNANDEGYFRNKNNMWDAFKFMSTGRDQQFPQVQLFFEQKFKELVWANEPEELKKARPSLVVEELGWSEKSKKALFSLMELIKVRITQSS
jgi:hypothetical protein